MTVVFAILTTAPERSNPVPKVYPPEGPPTCTKTSAVVPMVIGN